MAWLTNCLRDCKQWNDEKLELSTSSNEAAKLYDSAVRQYVSWMEAEELGGFAKTLEKMMESDPTFVMGKTLEIGLTVIGTKSSIRTDTEFREKFLGWQKIVKSTKLSDREKLHIAAVEKAVNGDFAGAAEQWEEILRQYPTDVVALKHAQTAYVFTGDSQNLRDSPVRIWQHWNKGMPLYGHVEGLMAFGYEEMGQFNQAECHAKSALEINKQDAWAAHAIAHVMELQGRLEEGIKFMDKTSSDWKDCSWVAGHNYWHWALLHLENLEPDAALELYDSKMKDRTAVGNMLDVSNATSLLYRLQLEGIDVGNRWESVTEVCQPMLYDHITSFNDAHFLMAALNAKSEQTLHNFQDSLESHAKSKERNPSVEVCEEVGLHLAQGMIAYNEKKFTDAAEALIAIFDQVYRIGGSRAQRDVFSQLAIRACLKSSVLEHNKKASELFAKRQSWFVTSPLMERIGCRIRAAQGQA